MLTVPRSTYGRGSPERQSFLWLGQAARWHCGEQYLVGEAGEGALTKGCWPNVLWRLIRGNNTQQRGWLGSHDEMMGGRGSSRSRRTLGRGGARIDISRWPWFWLDYHKGARPAQGCKGAHDSHECTTYPAPAKNVQMRITPHWGQYLLQCNKGKLYIS